MNEFIIENITTILGCGTIIVTLIAYLFQKNFSKAREQAYELILKAEKMLKSKTGQEKMEYVKETIYKEFPAYIKLFITKEQVEILAQLAFDKLVDYLDDGKINSSNK